MPEPLSPARLADIGAKVERAHTEIGEVCAEGPSRRFRMSIPANPARDTDLIVSEALKGAEDLLAEVDRLRTPPPPGELRGLDGMCAALHAATETDPVVKEVAWRTFALIRAHREQSAEVDRLKAELADLQGQNALTESHFNNHVAESIVEQNALTKRAEAAEIEAERLRAQVSLMGSHLQRESMAAIDKALAARQAVSE